MPKSVFIPCMMIAGLMLWGVVPVASADETSADGSGVEWNKYADSETGHEVWQITSHAAGSESFYFYAQSFTSDDRYATFRSKRSGVWDAYRCDLTNGSIQPLTAGADIDRACMHPDGIHLAYISDWRLYFVNVHTLEKEEKFDFRGKMPSRPYFRPTFTRDGRYTLAYTRDENTGNRLYRLDLLAGELLMVLAPETGSFSHEQINPVHPNLIAYAPLPDTQNDMSLPMDKRPRTRLIQVDKGTNEPFLVVPYGFRATHDFWSPRGDRYYFFEKAQPGWTPVSIASIDIHGKDYTRHYTDADVRLGHGAASMDGKWFVSDSQESFSNPLILLHLEDGKTQTLCRPNASVNTPARVHVHPNFSASGHYVIFTSDASQQDIPQVYVMPIQSIKNAFVSTNGQ